MQLAVFDLDHTLLRGDSDFLWGECLVRNGLVDETDYRARNAAFHEDYVNGVLDIHAFCRFSFAPLVAHGSERLEPLRQRFVTEDIAPLIAPGAPALLAKHRAQGDHIVITTATNRFVTEPIAELLGVRDLIATDPERIDGAFTGNIAGAPNFREGKPLRLREWLAAHQLNDARMTCYSDSRNDIPLLEMAHIPVAVDPDPVLADTARQRGWRIISLKRADDLSEQNPPAGA